MPGYIKLYRKLLENPIMKKPALLQLWNYCLLKANYETKKAFWGDDEVTVQPGQFITGRFELSRDLGGNPNTIYKRLQTLRRMGFVNTKSNNKNTLVTLINWELYQSEELKGNNRLNNKVTTNEQQSNTTKNIKNIRNKENIYSSKAFSEDSDFYILSVKLRDFILKNNPEAKQPDLQKWAAEFDKMIRLDNRNIQHICEVIEFSQTDAFWKTNILSPKKLREKYDTLNLQRQNKKEQPAKDKPRYKDFDQRKYDKDYFEKIYKAYDE